MEVLPEQVEQVEVIEEIVKTSLLMDIQIDLAPMTSLLIQLTMVLIGIAFFSGFGIKKMMQFLKSY